MINNPKQTNCDLDEIEQLILEVVSDPENREKMLKIQEIDCQNN